MPVFLVGRLQLSDSELYSIFDQTLPLAFRIELTFLVFLFEHLSFAKIKALILLFESYPLIKLLLHFLNYLKLLFPNQSDFRALSKMGFELQKILLNESHKHQQRRTLLYVFSAPLDQFQEKYTTHYLLLLVAILLRLRQ